MIIDNIIRSIDKVIENFNNNAENEEEEGEEYDTDKEYVSGSEDELEF